MTLDQEAQRDLLHERFKNGWISRQSLVDAMKVVRADIPITYNILGNDYVILGIASDQDWKIMIHCARNPYVNVCIDNDEYHYRYVSYSHFGPIETLIDTVKVILGGT
jgi:hypothetical protein